MELNEMEKRLLYQTEGSEWYAVLHELAVASRFAKDLGGRKGADSLIKKLNSLTDGECIEIVYDIRKNYRIRGAVIHSDRGTQYTSETYRRAVAKHGILQSMNSAGGRCHDNARCESMWARMKEELLYGRHHTKKMTVEEVKTLIFRYFIGYWNNRRICSANKGLPPMVKRQRYYESLDAAA